MEMMLDKKQIWAIFLFEFRMSHKAAETTCNINNTFGPDAANECIVQWWFKKFCKGDRSIEDEECSGQPSEVDSDQLRASLKLILLQLHEKLNKNSVLTILQSCGLRSKLTKWKSLISECLINWSQIKKIGNTSSVLFSFATRQQWTVSWSDGDVRWKVDFI